jgi:hypothetical protein
LHIAAFVTPCEAYMGIESHFNLWNYFDTRLQQGSGADAVVLGGVDIFVRFGQRFDHYFHLPMSGLLNGWWKVWFLLRNDTDVLLPVFTGRFSVPQPN